MDALTGVRNLTDFALSTRRSIPPRLVFASSIGIFKNIPRPEEGCIPEEPVDNPYTSVGTGYSESKWVAERILESSRPRANPLVVRVGQLAGGVGGNWDVNEWLPALVRTGLTMGRLPELKGVSYI
jgi:thioester reductase-like protein